MKEKSLLKQFATIGVGTLISLLVSVFTTPVITRLVNPIQYGQLTIFKMYSSIGLMILCLGLDQALVRYYYRKDSIEYKRQLILRTWKLPVIISVIIGIVVYVSVNINILRVDLSNKIIIIYFVSLIFQIINRFSMLVVRLEYHTKLYSFLNVLHKGIYVFLGLVFILNINYNPVELLIISLMISHIVTSAIGIICENRLWNMKDIKIDNAISKVELIKYGIPFIFSMGVTTLFQSVDKFTLNYYGSYSDVGVYAAAMSIVNIFALIQSTFNTLWAPLAIKDYEENPNNKQFLIKGNQVITVIMFFIGIILILFKDIFVLLLGQEYREAAYILPFLIFNPIMYTMSETTVLGIVYKSKSSMHVWVALLSLLCNTIGNIILVPIYGGRGAAISTGVSYIIFFTARTLISNKYYYVDYSLRKFYIMTAIVIIYAVYNTFIKFNFFTIFGAVICLIVLFILYSSTVRYITDYVLTRFKKQFNKLQHVEK